MSARRGAGRFFIAGASGATGQFVVAEAQARGLDFVAHYRPRRGAPDSVKGAAVFELGDTAALEAALRGSTSLLQLVGTRQERFAEGDTYQQSDVGTTRLLVEAAKAAGVEHLVLLSSVGAGQPAGLYARLASLRAGRPMEPYLRAKAEAERIVRESGLTWTIFRPGALWGGARQVRGANAMEWVARGLGLSTLRPVPLSALARGLIASGLEQAPANTVLEGKAFWAWLDAHPA